MRAAMRGVRLLPPAGTTPQRDRYGDDVISDADDDSAVDATELLVSWERMSAHYLPGRAALLAQAAGWLRDHDPAATVVELGAGPGTTLGMLREELPAARLIGVDNDPVLECLHEAALPPAASIAHVVADLSSPSWTRALPSDIEPTAVIAVQVLHYFAPPRFDQLLEETHAALGSGGVFIHVDHVPTGGNGADPFPVDAGEHREATVEANDPWTQWWQAATGVPALAAGFEQRSASRSSSGGSAEYHPTQDVLERHLKDAGFRSIVHRKRYGRSLLTIVSAD